LKDPPKFTQTGILGLKICHLATLIQRLSITSTLFIHMEFICNAWNEALHQINKNSVKLPYRCQHKKLKTLRIQFVKLTNRQNDINIPLHSVTSMYLHSTWTFYMNVEEVNKMYRKLETLFFHARICYQMYVPNFDNNVSIGFSWDENINFFFHVLRKWLSLWSEKDL
jgi:hypothetical protein